MKKYKFLLSLFISIVLLEFLFWLIHWPCQITLFVLVPFVFSLQQLYRAIADLIIGDKLLVVTSFLISFLILNICLKIFFTYYNLFIHLLIILVSIYIIRAKPPEGNLIFSYKRKYILIPITVLSSIFLFTSDALILKVLNSKNRVPYFDPSTLTWNDFKGKPEDKKIMVMDSIALADASINSSYYYKVNSLYNYPQVVCIAAMNPEESWTKKYSEGLLNHERTHFLISELFARKVNEYNKEWPANEDSLEAKVNNLYDSLAYMQDQFDKETSHGADREKELHWEKRIGELIEK